MVADPLVGTIQDHDLSITDNRWKCSRVSELTELAKAGYWVWRTFQWVAKLPI